MDNQAATLVNQTLTFKPQPDSWTKTTPFRLSRDMFVPATDGE